MDETDLLERTKSFSLRVLKLVDALPNSVSGRAIRAQLVRSGTSVGANYRAACRGRSKREFVAKLGVVEEEADESAFWMDLVLERGLLKESLIQPLRDEAEAICKIMARSRITAASRLKD